MRKNGWADAEVEFLKNNAGHLTDDEIAAQLSQMTGRKITRTACTQRRARLGLKKLRGRKKKNGGQRLAPTGNTEGTTNAALPNPVVEQQESTDINGTVKHDAF